ncbi:hypothetical protein AALP_AA6G311000 [Arabis alpina]|uniref:RING-type E3 ubiquitin transferase n=1 Tax=Arabis alpina TaxID=50452 RepID=A0A087GSV1_ARAAL|nr:hypothetical protein AALP_AA6G311000 [Arabis alpina]
MRLDVHTPLLAPSPPPTAAVDTDGKMVPVVFMALLLPCVGVCFLFFLYLFLLWCSTRRRMNRLRSSEPVKSVTGKGLSKSELEKLPKLTGEELAVVGRTTECAVCLEEIESGQPARLVPGCNHGFHRLCADTWLSDHTVCPVCRAELAHKFSQCSEDHSPC